jgi:hypothetical protein
MNLVTNARDAMPQGGKLSIETKLITLPQERTGTLKTIPAGDYMVLSVADTGSGISEQNLTTIFQPFFSTKSNSKGTGLGLAILDNIVKEHQAFIDVDTILQQGTTFHVYFPLVTNGEDDTKDITRPEDTIDPSQKTILLADDDWLLRKSLAVFLQKQGYNILTATDGDEAVATYKRHRGAIDMIILDVIMPKKNGREAYDILKEENPQLQALFISGSTEAVLKEKKILDNGLDFLAKPLDMTIFSSRIKELLTRKNVPVPR